jgi:hypothetical protein
MSVAGKYGLYAERERRADEQQAFYDWAALSAGFSFSNHA